MGPAVNVTILATCDLCGQPDAECTEQDHDRVPDTMVCDQCRAGVGPDVVPITAALVVSLVGIIALTCLTTAADWRACGVRGTDRVEVCR